VLARIKNPLLWIGVFIAACTAVASTFALGTLTNHRETWLVFAVAVGFALGHRLAQKVVSHKPLLMRLAVLFLLGFLAIFFAASIAGGSFAFLPALGLGVFSALFAFAPMRQTSGEADR
jgi:hypothetical protein